MYGHYKKIVQKEILEIKPGDKISLPYVNKLDDFIKLLGNIGIKFNKKTPKNLTFVSKAVFNIRREVGVDNPIIEICNKHFDLAITIEQDSFEKHSLAYNKLLNKGT